MLISVLKPQSSVAVNPQTGRINEFTTEWNKFFDEHPDISVLRLNFEREFCFKLRLKLRSKKSQGTVRDRQKSIAEVAAFLGVADVDLAHAARNSSLEATKAQRLLKFEKFGVEFYENLCYRVGETGQGEKLKSMNK